MGVIELDARSAHVDFGVCVYGLDDRVCGAMADVDRRAAGALRRVRCSRCNAALNALVAKGFGWENDPLADCMGRPGSVSMVCNPCLDRLVFPLAIERREWFASAASGGAGYMGQEAYEAQFFGAHTLIARFVPGTRLEQMRLPATGGDDWRLEQDDGAMVLVRADYF